MRTRHILAAIAASTLAAAVVFTSAASRPEIAPIEPTMVVPYAPEAVARGARLAVLGNCNTCHTTPGGRPYAGGRALPTPFGSVYSTNITPDAVTGIGRWSEAAFVRALREGVDRAGRHLYPAFPYDHFARMEAADLHALYAYFMSREPVSARARDNELMFPFNLRPLLAVWKWLYLRAATHEPDRERSPEFNRGAYLVDGIAHCGSCHTPRNLLGAERHDHALAGGTIEGWHAPALTAASPSPKPWTAGELYLYLRYGLAAEHAIAAGPMRPVVHNLSMADDDDVRAIAVYVGALMNEAAGKEREQRLDGLLARARGSGAPIAQRPQRGGEDPLVALGAALYAGACASCHARGRGPSHSEDALLLPFGIALHLGTPRNLLQIVLDGIEPGPAEAGRWMPGFVGAFTDEQLAALAAYLRAAFTTEPAWSELAAEVRAVQRERGRR